MPDILRTSSIIKSYFSWSFTNFERNSAHKNRALRSTTKRKARSSKWGILHNTGSEKGSEPLHPQQEKSGQIAWYSLRNFSTSVPSIFLSTSFRAIFWIKGRSMSVIFLPSRSFTVASIRERRS